MRTVRVITDKIIPGGDCLAKSDGKVIFIPGALAGETLLVEITEEKKDFCRARIIEVISPSEHRVTPLCPYYGTCGGCNLQMASYDYQVRAKKECVAETFTRAGLPSGQLPEITSVTGNPWEYRNRFKLCDGGFKARESHTVIPVRDCPVAVPEIRAFLAEGRCPPGEIQIYGVNGTVTAAREGTKRPYRSAAMNPDYMNVCTVNVRGLPFRFDVRGFFQSNAALLDKTVQLVCGGLSGERAADIYSGVGLFARFLADSFDRTVLVEHDKGALAAAEKNTAGKSCEFFAVRGAKWTSLPQSRLTYDAVVVDPPRTGLEKEVVDWLAAAKPAKIRMLSCDPVTAARDCARLFKAGYKIEKLYMIDFYPQTSHIETLTCLSPGNA